MSFHILSIFYGFLVISVALLLNFILRSYPFLRRAWQTPKLQPHYFLVGNLIAFWTNRNNLTEYLISASYAVRDRGFQTLWVFYYPVLAVFSWRHNKKILGNKKFLNRGWPSRKLTHSFTGLISLADKEWKVRRKLVAPSFMPGVLENFVPTILHHTQLMLDDFATTSSDALDPLPIISQHLVSTALKTSLGLKEDDCGELGSELTRAMRSFLDYQFDRIFRFYTWNDQVFRIYSWMYGIRDERKLIESNAKRIVQARINERNASANEHRAGIANQRKLRHQAFLDSMLDYFTNSTTTSDGDLEDLIGELITIMITSFETIANMTVWFLHNVAHNPDIQQKLFEELLDFDEKNENMTISQINQLTYLDQCFKENLRLHPPVANMVRMIDDDIMLDDCIIPKGILSVTFIYFIHHDEEIYPEPEKFDPSRFSPENIAKIPSGAYVPFGDGPRRCVGERLAILEAKIILINLIKRFQVEPIAKEMAQVKIDLLTRPKETLKFKFIPRN